MQRRRHGVGLCRRCRDESRTRVKILPGTPFNLLHTHTYTHARKTKGDEIQPTTAIFVEDQADLEREVFQDLPLIRLEVVKIAQRTVRDN